MTFIIVIGDDEVYSTENQVRGLRFLTKRGEAAAMRVAPDIGALEIKIDTIYVGGYPDLDYKEAVASKNLAASREGEVAGPPTATEDDIRLELRRGAQTDTAAIGDDFEIGKSDPVPGVATEDSRDNIHLRSQEPPAVSEKAEKALLKGTSPSDIPGADAVEEAKSEKSKPALTIKK